VDDDNPYVPLNSPAIGDLFDLFHFDHDRDHARDHDHNHYGDRHDGDD
jgi:phospholipase C